MNQNLLKALARRRIEEVQTAMTETFGMAVLDLRHYTNRVFISIPGKDFTSFTFTGKEKIFLHTSAAGKAILAYMPEPQRSAVIRRMQFPRLTPNTIAGEKEYRKELEIVKRRGYATDFEEEVLGCRCGAVPVCDPSGCAVAVLFVSGMAKRLSPAVLKKNILTLRGAARRLEGDIAKVQEGDVSQGKFSPFTLEVMKELMSRLTEPVPLETLATTRRISYSSLRTLFKKETGLSLGRYYLRLRLEEVCRLLSETSLTLHQISAQVGFCGEKHLSAIFRKNFGMPPGVYRRMIR